MNKRMQTTAILIKLVFKINKLGGCFTETKRNNSIHKVREHRNKLRIGSKTPAFVVFYFLFFFIFGRPLSASLMHLKYFFFLMKPALNLQTIDS